MRINRKGWEEVAVFLKDVTVKEWRNALFTLMFSMALFHIALSVITWGARGCPVEGMYFENSH